MTTDQLCFASLLAEAEQRARATRDLHRGRVQTWFDALSEEHKRSLGEYMTEHEWDTCAALSVAACDWQRSRMNGARH
jgi:hypothetical protein